MAYSKQNKTVLRQPKVWRLLKNDFLTSQSFPLCYRDQAVNDAL